jgi:hypothetical protein
LTLVVQRQQWTADKVHRKLEGVFGAARRGPAVGRAALADRVSWQSLDSNTGGIITRVWAFLSFAPPP